MRFPYFRSQQLLANLMACQRWNKRASRHIGEGVADGSIALM
jgi:hypothetical protein